MPNECPVVNCSTRPDQPHKMPGCRVVALFWVQPKSSQSMHKSSSLCIGKCIPCLLRRPWIAPECCVKLSAMTSESDVYSFGVTVWEMFSLGKRPDEVTACSHNIVILTYRVARKSSVSHYRTTGQWQRKVVKTLQ